MEQDLIGLPWIVEPAAVFLRHLEPDALEPLVKCRHLTIVILLAVFKKDVPDGDKAPGFCVRDLVANHVGQDMDEPEVV